jgi:Flp pilus assembly protein TadD
MDDTARARLLLEAEGYFELGMMEDSLRVLAQLPPDEQFRPEALALRLVLLMATKSWSSAAEIAACLVEREPQDSGWWVNYAYCVRRAQSVDEAEKILLRATELHPSVAIIRYNLACYACVTGRLQEARERLAQAREIDASVVPMALQDEDLHALRDWIEAGDWESAR